MKSFIRSLSAPAEFCIVVLISFGLPLTANVLAIARREMNVQPRPVRFDNHTLLVMFVIEAVTLAVIYFIGHIRGWARDVFRVQATWRWTVFSIFLYAVSVLANRLVQAYGHTHGLYSAPHPPLPPGSQLTLPFILLNSVTNPIFEETLEVGYVVSALKRFGMWPAVLASAFIRASLHIYQGDTGALAMFAMGAIFGLVYWRWRELWPLIVAHALMDFLFLEHIDIVRVFRLY